MGLVNCNKFNQALFYVQLCTQNVTATKGFLKGQKLTYSEVCLLAIYIK